MPKVFGGNWYVKNLFDFLHTFFDLKTWFFNVFKSPFSFYWLFIMFKQTSRKRVFSPPFNTHFPPHKIHESFCKRVEDVGPLLYSFIVFVYL